MEMEVSASDKIAILALLISVVSALFNFYFTKKQIALTKQEFEQQHYPPIDVYLKHSTEGGLTDVTRTRLRPTVKIDQNASTVENLIIKVYVADFARDTSLLKKFFRKKWMWLMTYEVPRLEPGESLEDALKKSTFVEQKFNSKYKGTVETFLLENNSALIEREEIKLSFGAWSYYRLNRTAPIRLRLTYQYTIKNMLTRTSTKRYRLIPVFANQIKNQLSSWKLIMDSKRSL